MTAPYLRGCFLGSSNGLASGNHWLEAVAHALCEVIERDATSLWTQRPEEARRATRLDLDTIEDPMGREVLDQLAAAHMAVALWDETSDIAVPCIKATIADQEHSPFRRLPATGGHGCHPDAGVALVRALTEAAQSRLTLIAGSRDDIRRDAYQHHRASDIFIRNRERVFDAPTPRCFSSVGTTRNDTVDDDVAQVTEAILAAGAGPPITIDLTKADVGVPVVKVIAPGLEPGGDAATTVPGPRARALL